MTRKNVLWTIRGKNFSATATEYTSGEAPEPYPLPRQTWLRAIKFLKTYGEERALQLIDERAWRAFRRGDDETSRRWRDLIIAIHAMTPEDDNIQGTPQ